MDESAEEILEIRELEERQREAAKQTIALAEKIADLIASENVTVDMAERALRRAGAIMRTHTIVKPTSPDAWGI